MTTATAAPSRIQAVPAGIALALAAAVAWRVVAAGDVRPLLLVIGLGLGVALYHAAFGFSAAYRRLLVDGLRALGFGVPELPKGAFYVLADARAFGSDSRRLAFDLLERSGVAATPGIDFGEAGEGFLRFCYAAAEEEILEALEWLAPALREMA